MWHNFHQIERYTPFSISPADKSKVGKNIIIFMARILIYIVRTVFHCIHFNGSLSSILLLKFNLIYFAPVTLCNKTHMVVKSEYKVLLLESCPVYDLVILGRVHANEKAQKIARNPIFSKAIFV